MVHWTIVLAKLPFTHSLGVGTYVNTMTPEIEGKLRQFKRMLLSYADFKHAKLVSTHIIDQNLHEPRPGEGDTLLEALNCSMIIAYCRPFSGNDRSAPDLPAGFLKCLTADEREVHEIVLMDRNKVLAHSDADWLDVESVVWHVSGRQLVVPLKGWGLAPLNRETTVAFNAAAEKLLTAVVTERHRLEPELMPYMRIADPENPFA